MKGILKKSNTELAGRMGEVGTKIIKDEKGYIVLKSLAQTNLKTRGVIFKTPNRVAEEMRSIISDLVLLEETKIIKVNKKFS